MTAVVSTWDAVSEDVTGPSPADATAWATMKSATHTMPPNTTAANTTTVTIDTTVHRRRREVRSGSYPVTGSGTGVGM